MIINKNGLLLVLFLIIFSNFLSAQKDVKNGDGFYKKEMQSLQASIHTWPMAKNWIFIQNRIKFFIYNGAKCIS